MTGDIVISNGDQIAQALQPVLDKLCEGRDLVDMLATDIPDLAAWSTEVDELLGQLEVIGR